jgi:hypothetical protein
MDDVLGVDADDQAVTDRTADLRAHTTDVAGLAAIPPPTPLVQGWLTLDSLAWVVGEPGSAKSFTVQDFAGCITNGVDWHGHPVKQANVLYVVLEGAPGLGQRIRTWEDYYQMSHGAYFLVPRGRVHLVQDAEPLARVAKDLEAGLVVIDTQNRATVGLDENSNVDMSHMIAGMEAIRYATGACVCNVHHTGIGSQRPRGHSSIDGAADTLIRVAKDGGLVKIANTKQKEAGSQASVMLNATDHAGGLVLAAPKEGEGLAVTKSERDVYKALKDVIAAGESATPAQVRRSCGSTGMSESTFFWALKRLRERQMVGKDTKNRLILTNPTQGAMPW